MDMIIPNLILLPITIAVPAIVLYFVIKLAIKNAVVDLKKENIL